jgi:uncharacterized membrane protein
MAPEEPTSPDHAALRRLVGSLQEEVTRLERAAAPGVGVAGRVVERDIVPAWRRATEGEHRLPVAAVIAVAIALQLVLPSRLVIGPAWLLPTMEGLLFIGLTTANPRRLNRTSNAIRAASVALIALISLANAFATARLIDGLINGTEGDSASVLISRGASVYITNIIVFALWYWEWDRGGPVARSQGLREYPDFLFPQMTQPSLASPDWEPNFLDYLYVSFTNAAAFSPTDTMPLTRWAKMLMLVQSAVALLTVAFVIARAVNVLK